MWISASTMWFSRSSSMHLNLHYLLLSVFIIASSFLHQVSSFTESYVMVDRCSHLIDMEDQHLSTVHVRLTDSDLYRPHLACRFAVRAPPGKGLVVMVQWMDIAVGRFDSCADFLQIFNGDFENTTGAITGLQDKVCGDIIPPPVTSAGRAVTLYFDSNTYEHGAGFSILFTAYHQGRCQHDEFTCDNGRCIDKRLKCDDDDNCGDNSDDCRLTIGDVVVAVIVSTLIFIIIVGLACLYCNRDKIKLKIKKKCPTISANPDGVYQPTTEPVQQQGNNNQPTPSQPTPSQPTPTQPTPSQPTPSQPTPTQPTPNQPTPSQPTPTPLTPTETV